MRSLAFEVDRSGNPVVISRRNRFPIHDTVDNLTAQMNKPFGRFRETTRKMETGEVAAETKARNRRGGHSRSPISSRRPTKWKAAESSSVSRSYPGRQCYLALLVRVASFAVFVVRVCCGGRLMDYAPATHRFAIHWICE